MFSRPSWTRWGAVGLLMLLVVLVGLLGAVRARGDSAQLARWGLSAVAWQGAAAQSASRGSLGPGNPVGQSGARLSRLQLGFWPAVQGVATPTPPPAHQLWVPWAVTQWP